MIDVEVVYCREPGHADVTPLSLPDGATLRDALAASGVAQRHGFAIEEAVCGVWGRRQALDGRLRTRDRVEVYRGLKCDPKEARRLRYRQRKERSARGAQAPVSGSPRR
jgi:hypothetical protein